MFLTSVDLERIILLGCFWSSLFQEASAKVELIRKNEGGPGSSEEFCGLEMEEFGLRSQRFDFG